MLELLLIAAAAQEARLFIPVPDPPRGPMPAEFRTLSQPHPNARPEGTFPDLAVKDLRFDGDTLYVLVANDGGASASGPIRVNARAEAAGARNAAAAARIGKLKAGESKWVPLDALSADASLVSVTVSQPAPVAVALDRTGQRRDRTDREVDESNNSLTLAGSAIARGQP